MVNAQSDPEQSRRRARRAFIRTHHPDAGGDHAGFVTGLAELDARPDVDTHTPPAPSAAEVPATGVADQPWPVSITTSLLRRARRRTGRRRVG